MRALLTASTACFIMLTLAACGCDCDKRPIIVQSAAPDTVPSVIESHCKHGYDDQTHSCY